MANGVRIHRPRRSEALERIGARERTSQASGCGSSTRHPDLEKGGQGGILSPMLRRRAIQHVTTIFSISQRRACRVVGQHRSVQRRKIVENTYRTRLATRLRALSRKHPRRGWRYIQDLLGREGWRVNHKRLRHFWRNEGLKVNVNRRIQRKLNPQNLAIFASNQRART